MQNQIRILRTIGVAEGVSFLVLLLIAMPLKYYFGFPMAVKIVGWAHGGLFIAYIILVFLSIKLMGWTWFEVLVALAASLVPFGTIFLDRSWKRRQKDLIGADPA